jgi:hypothetical protein
MLFFLRIRGWLWSVGLIGSILATGCSESTGTVTGTVTFNGEPLQAGKVTFFHPSKPGRNVMADIQPDGTYRILACPAGESKVTVQPLPPKSGSSRGKPYVPGSRKATDKAPPVPAKYNDPATTDIICRVTSGSQTFNIDLRP